MELYWHDHWGYFTHGLRVFDFGVEWQKVEGLRRGAWLALDSGT